MPFRSPTKFPRIGLDGFVIDGLSLGGSFTVIHTEPEGGSTTDVLVAPRIGFGFMFGRVVGIWPRGGISYWHQSGPGDNLSAHSFAFDLDVPLLIAPTRSFAFEVGPILDVSFGGSRDVDAANTTNSVDTSFTQFGISAGIVGLL